MRGVIDKLTKNYKMNSLHFKWDTSSFKQEGNNSQNPKKISVSEIISSLDSMDVDIDSNYCISDININSIKKAQVPLYPIHTPITYHTIYLKLDSYVKLRYIVNNCLTSFTQQLYFLLRILQGNELLVDLYREKNVNLSELVLHQKVVHTLYRDWRLLLEFNPHKELLRLALLDFVKELVQIAEPEDDNSYASLNVESDMPSPFESLSEDEKIIFTVLKKKDVEMDLDLFWPKPEVPYYLNNSSNIPNYYDLSSLKCLHKIELSTVCLWIAWIYTANEEFERAKCWYNACVKVTQNSKNPPQGPQNMFIFYSRARLWDESNLLIREYRKALNFLPKCPLPLNNCAIAYTKINEPHEALKCYDYSLSLDPNYVLSFNNRASLWGNELKNPTRAEKDYESAIKLGEDLSSTYMYRASMYKNVCNDFVRCIDDYTTCLKLGVANLEELYCDRADAYFNISEFENALNDFSACLAINPGNLEALYGRGRLYSEALNNPELALQDYTQCIEECFKQNASNITKSAAFNNRGVLYHDRYKDIPRAMRDFQIAVQLHPSSIYAYQNLRDLQLRIRQTWAVGNI